MAETWQEAAVVTFYHTQAGAVQKALGLRPHKQYNANYLHQTGFAGKYMFWDEELGKYTHVRDGDRFVLTADGPRRFDG